LTEKKIKKLYLSELDWTDSPSDELLLDRVGLDQIIRFDNSNF